MFGEEIIKSLKQGGVGIIPTDTLYGIVASALSPLAVELVYAIRNRDLEKACIVLVSGISDLEHFSVRPSSKEQEWIDTVWPGKVSVMLPCTREDFNYLSRGTGHLVFRVPDNEALRELLREVGPLIAPSANPQGGAPAETIDDAKKYFGDQVDFYVDGGTLQSKPSTIVHLENDHVTVLRPGAVEIKATAL